MASSTSGPKRLRPGSLKRQGRQLSRGPTLEIPEPFATALCGTSSSASESASSAFPSSSKVKLVPPRPTLTSKKEYIHPYLSGNFAPVTTECPLTDCLWAGQIPNELAGCQYVRNGGNPLANSQLDRDAHWFDADGMLAGVLFRRREDGSLQPSFLNRFILTDLLLSTPEHSQLPYLPSIATLVNPHTSFLRILSQILRSFLLAILTWLPGLGLRSDEKLRRISVANTSVFWHDGKAMAGCESGPPMRIMLPGLETAGWYTGKDDDNDPSSKGFGDSSLPMLGMLREFTTAHPRIDPQTGELLLYHMCFEPPFLRVSVIPSSTAEKAPVLSMKARANAKVLKGSPVRGLQQPKMMHDFGATSTHTVILDLPLSLDMMNLVKGKPILHYDPSKPSRFGILPRYEPDQVRWFDSPEACCVYHTANSWNDDRKIGAESCVTSAAEEPAAVNMLGCRLNSATLVYSAGNLLPPSHVLPPPDCPEKCQLYYWRFDLESNKISHEFALSDVPFEFPSINEDYSMKEARYVYGTSMRDGLAKIDALVKVDVHTLIRRGKQKWAQGKLERGDSVDTQEILESQRCGDTACEGEEAIQIFEMPRGWYAQETTFVPRDIVNAAEDDGWLICYVFDEGQGLHPSTGEVLPGATSELWIIDAKGMKDVVCRIKLPQRVPYGLHGTLFTEEQIQSQKPIDPSKIRSWASSVNNMDPFSSSSLGSSFVGTIGKKSSGAFPSSREAYNAFLRDPIRIGAWWIKRNIEFLLA
ncbi:LOW QUALITY PROTEIN: carotenoid oxygenase [Testicularia cyperi]|uniref:Carotenoid oxygenase n=1 Tax=Testicularia cyperi TaxID=1882483 RepID=A0A317XTA5_9BASI|nr:LOW QUALITY PROTEIN: carotenoid oxygenase [Testicularia cyperi]